MGELEAKVKDLEDKKNKLTDKVSILFITINL